MSSILMQRQRKRIKERDNEVNLRAKRRHPTIVRLDFEDGNAPDDTHQVLEVNTVRTDV